MKLTLDSAPLFLIVETVVEESAGDLFASLTKRYDPRLNDPEWGPLYQIGSRFECEGRYFFQIQTYAGSLAARMMIDVRKKVLDRAILMGADVVDDFELIAPNGENRTVKRESLKAESRKT